MALTNCAIVPLLLKKSALCDVIEGLRGPREHERFHWPQAIPLLILYVIEGGPS